MIFWIIVIAVILTIIIISKIKYRNYKKTVGRIIQYEEENNKHYPIFQFETIQGEKIEERNHLDGFDACVEDGLSFDAAEEFLRKKLPIENILIKYDKNNPKNFLAKWL